jgi:hypothetical protein
MSSSPVDRRTFLGALIGFPITMGILTPGPTGPFFLGHPSVSREFLESVVGDWDAARRLGEAYLRQHPDEADREWLLREVMGDSAPGGERLQRLASRRRQDLHRGTIVIVDGWVLARTEARLCAAASRLAF